VFVYCPLITWWWYLIVFVVASLTSFFPSFLVVAIPLSVVLVCSICRCGKKGGGLISVSFHSLSVALLPFCLSMCFSLSVFYYFCSFGVYGVCGLLLCWLCY